MDFQFSPAAQSLRDEAIDFVRREWNPQGYDVNAGIMNWHTEDPEADALVTAFAKKLVAKDWWVMHWPVEHGGQGISLESQLAFREAMAYMGAPVSLGGGLVTPPLMLHGQEWQQRELLPMLANADALDFAMGLSEPNAGSDLASLTTRAVRDGDNFVVDGQKTWNSLAHKAPWGLFFVRTDPDVPKHRGISALLIEMETPGITIRPLYDGTGRRRWSEIFFDNVRVPVRNLVGELDRGWYVAMAGLNFERSNIEGPASLIRVIEEYVEFCKALKRKHGSSPLDEPVIQHQLADFRLETETARMLSYRVAWMQAKGEVPVKEASMTKIWTTNLQYRILQRLSLSLAEFGTLLPGNKFELPLQGYLNSRAYAAIGPVIGGGTTDIQKNIIAQRGLGLPR